MAQRLAITRRGLTLRPLARPTKDIFFEDLDSASARGARLTLAMRDGERVTLWTRGAKASAAANHVRVVPVRTQRIIPKKKSMVISLG